MTPTAWVVVVLGGLLTFSERVSLLLLGRRAAAVPPEVRRALRMIPPAALAALVAPAVLRGGSPDGGLALADPRVLAAAVAMLVMWRTGQVLLTLGAGLGLLILLQAVRG